MANWNTPALSDTYTDVLSLLKSRDDDAGSLYVSAPTNPITGAFRYNRSTNKFEEYGGASWDAKTLSVAGGGTGATTAGGALTNLGVGTMGTQSAASVTITGGTLTNVTIGNTNAIAADAITSALVGTARLGSGTANSSTYLRGDQTWASVAGAGDVVGPASATDNALVRFDTTTGKLIQNSGWTLGDTGAMAGTSMILGSPTGGDKGTGTLNATALYVNNVAVATGTAVPSGMIAIFDTSCPSGWTRVSAFDNRTLMGAVSYGTTGGSATHDHAVDLTTDSDGSHDHGAVTGATDIGVTPGTAEEPTGPTVGVVTAISNANHTHSITSGGAHTHTITTGSVDSASSWPPYITVVFCKKD